MKRGIVNLVLGLLVTCSLGPSAAFAEDEDAPRVAPRPTDQTIVAPDPVEVRRLERTIRWIRAEINLWNLVNGLHLSASQLEAIIAAATEARDLRAEAVPAQDAEALEEVARRLEEARDAIVAGQDEPDPAVEGAHAREARRVGPSRDPLMVQRKIVAIEDRVEAILLPAQREVMRTYKACLIPPKDLKDPVRVGQASDTTAEANFLKRAMAVPAVRWPVAGPRILEDVLEHEQKHNGRYSPEELATRRAAISAVFADARSLPPAEQMLRADSLVERLVAPDKTRALQDELAHMGDRARLPGKVAAFLLDERIIPVLERRLRQLEEAERAPVDLEAVEAADSCQGGRCAVKKEPKAP